MIFQKISLLLLGGFLFFCKGFQKSGFTLKFVEKLSSFVDFGCLHKSDTEICVFSKHHLTEASKNHFSVYFLNLQVRNAEL